MQRERAREPAPTCPIRFARGRASDLHAQGGMLAAAPPFPSGARDREILSCARCSDPLPLLRGRSRRGAGASRSARAGRVQVPELVIDSLRACWVQRQRHGGSIGMYGPVRGTSRKGGGHRGGASLFLFLGTRSESDIINTARFGTTNKKKKTNSEYKKNIS